MGLLRRGAAALAVGALLAPFAAVTALAAAPPTEADATGSLPEQQSVVISSEAVPVSLDRGSYSAAVIPRVIETPAPASATDRESVSTVAYEYAPAPQTYSGENVISYASQFIGKVPYGNGNSPDDSFACDGYVQYVLAQFGINLPRGANGQAARGTVIPASEARAGDLLWWPDQHIAFYDGAGGMLDSPDWGGFVRHREGIWGSPLYVRL